MNLSAQDRLRLDGEERATARLHRQCQREQEGRQTKVRGARLDRQSVHGEESITISGSIGVKLVRGPSCQLVLNIKI